MISSSWGRSRRIRAAAVLTVIAVATGVLVLALGAGVPDAWWPHTGQAFDASPPPAHEDPCRLTVGRAKAYGGNRAAHSTPAGHHSAATTGEAWGLVSLGAGVTALAVWRRRAAGPGRR